MVPSYSKYDDFLIALNILSGHIHLMGYFLVPEKSESVNTENQDHAGHQRIQLLLLGNILNYN